MKSPAAVLGQGAGGGERTYLGMSAESFDRVDSEGEFRRRLAAKRDSYELACAAARILFDPLLPAAAQHRTVWCHRAVKYDSGVAYGRRRKDRTSARLTGVITCGMVWTCQLCCRRVAESRREELERGMIYHTAQGGHVYLLTLTFPHELTLPLAEARAQFRKALEKLKASKAYRRVRALYGHIGSVRSLELTWSSAHGWHLHSHDLYFARPGLEFDQAAIEQLKGAWIAALLKVGLGAQSKVSWMWEHALDVRGGQYAAEYVAKFGRDARWGLCSEVTRSHVKVGMRKFSDAEGSVTPFQMLAWAADGDAEAVRLFREYAAAMADARMLYYSPGLKAKLGLVEREDAEIAGDDAPLPEEEEVFEISAEDLSLVLSRGALGELMEFACLVESDVQACVSDFIEMLRSRPRTARGLIRKKLWHMRGFSLYEPGRGEMAEAAAC